MAGMLAMFRLQQAEGIFDPLWELPLACNRCFLMGLVDLPWKSLTVVLKLELLSRNGINALGAKEGPESGATNMQPKPFAISETRSHVPQV